MKNIMSNYPKNQSVGFGAIAGFVGGLVMMGVAMSTTIMIGMPKDTIPKAIGTVFGASPDVAIPVGIGMHLLTSILVGVIFGIVTSRISKLHVTGYGKGIGLGVIGGIIAFVVISIPMSNFILPPILVKFLMMQHPEMTQQMAMNALQGKKAILISTAIIRHLVYGVVLGTITSVLVLRKSHTTRD